MNDKFVVRIQFWNTDIQTQIFALKEAQETLKYPYQLEDYLTVQLNPGYTREQFQQLTLSYYQGFLRLPYDSNEESEQKASQLKSMAQVEDFIFQY